MMTAPPPAKALGWPRDLPLPIGRGRAVTAVASLRCVVTVALPAAGPPANLLRVALGVGGRE